MGDLADQYDNIIQISTGFKIQVIDGYGGGILAAMSSGGGTGYFVDPFQKPSTEQPTKSVDIRMDDNVQLMGLGSRDFFAGSASVFISLLFSLLSVVLIFYKPHINFFSLIMITHQACPMFQ